MKIAWNKKSSNFELELIVENSKNIDEYCSKIILEDISSAGGGQWKGMNNALDPKIARTVAAVYWSNARQLQNQLYRSNINLSTVFLLATLFDVWISGKARCQRCWSSFFHMTDCDVNEDLGLKNANSPFLLPPVLRAQFQVGFLLFLSISS